MTDLEMPGGKPAYAACSNASNGSIMQAHVMYSNFSFLEADISLMSQEDAHFLDTQGCFKVPGRQAVDKFVREYFLHVHPSLPLLDESAFWEMYSQSDRSPRSGVSLSLFVFQAMLFVSSSVSLSTGADSLTRQPCLYLNIVYISYHHQRPWLCINAEREGNILPARKGTFLIPH
jgi:hypothetical protein